MTNVGGHVRTAILIHGSAQRASNSSGLLVSGGGGQPRLDDLAGLGGLAPDRGRLAGEPGQYRGDLP